MAENTQFAFIRNWREAATRYMLASKKSAEMMTEILTDKVKLKIAKKSDSKKIFELRTNPEVAKFINRDLNKNLSEIETFIENINSDFNNAMFFKINLLEENEIAGTICLWKINSENKYAEI